MHKKTVVSFYLMNRNNAVGSVFNLNRFNLIAENFNLIILTNQPSVITKYIKSAKVISLPSLYSIPFYTYLYWLLCRIILLTKKFDFLFLMTPDYLNSIFNFRQPIIISVNYNPIQVVGKRFGTTKLNIFFKFHLDLLIRGIAKSDKVIVVSEQLRRFCVDNGVNPQKIEYLPHGVDMTIFNPEIQSNDINIEKLKNKFIIMYSGWVSEIRGMEFLLNAMNIIKRDDIALVFLGCQSDYANKISKFAKSNGIEQNIVALDAVDPFLVPSYLKISHICVSILEVNEYYKTSPPQKLFEYLAMGKPVIANNIPTHTDYIINGYNGFIIEDINSFIEAVMRLYEDKSLYESISKNALTSAEAYDIKIVNAKLLNIMNDLAAQNIN